LVAEEAGRMTGVLSMDATGYLDMAFVLPEVMGTGTAAALYDALMIQARAAGLRRFTVRAAHQSKRILERRGWQVDRFERYPADGQVYDLFHMSLAE
jgi:putative acetyltransferase